VLFDIVHPAHVHFFKNMIVLLKERGHQVRIVAREKDVTIGLLDRLGFEYETVGRSEKKSIFGQARELLVRDLTLARVARSFKPDVIMTRNPSGAQVGRMLGVPAVFDTDDGRAVGIHWWAAAPFAHVITTPDCNEPLGPRHVTYPGYKQSAYLHPDHFTPDPGVLSELGVREGERFFIARFVEWVASHDSGEGGLAPEVQRSVVEELARHGKVVVSHEGRLPDEMSSHRFPLAPDRMHHALAFADLLVGESQTMCAEAAVLGTPSLRVSSFAGRLGYLGELEKRYGLTYGYQPTEVKEFRQHLTRWLGERSLREGLKEQHRRLMSEKVNVARWFVDFLEAGAPLPRFKPSAPTVTA
jgi:predicted glycosyltransferase